MRVALRGDGGWRWGPWKARSPARSFCAYSILPWQYTTLFVSPLERRKLKSFPLTLTRALSDCTDNGHCRMMSTLDSSTVWQCEGIDQFARNHGLRGLKIASKSEGHSY